MSALWNLILPYAFEVLATFCKLIPERKINGQAQKIVNDGKEQTFNSVSYTLCPVGNTDWVMKASKMTLNPEANSLASSRNMIKCQ
jgi:lipopolysaccharide assembly outer membrane protein LptD (OstA)